MKYLSAILLLFVLDEFNHVTAQEVPPAAKSNSQPMGSHLFADDALFFGYGPNYETPFVTLPGELTAADIARATIEFRHLDSWRLGDNLVDISLRKSNAAEPSSGGGTGALEPYGIFRSSLSYNKLTQSHGMTFGPFRDASLELGANLETKNSSFAPEERTIYFGPVFQAKIPRGFLNVGFHLRKEWNHEGILGKDESYSPDLNIESSWAIPITTHRVPLTFDGFADINTPKGNDSFGSPTHLEFITRPIVWLDLGSILNRAPRIVELGIGIEYWNNEYGKSAQTVSGASELTPIFELKVHLPRGGGN
jgi:hypothetical protein